MKRIVTIILAVDASPSVKRWRSDILKAVTDILERIDQADKDSIDFSYRVILLCFNSQVRFINPQPLPAGQLLELFGEEDYQLRGGTSIAALHGAVDKLFSRKEGGVLCELAKGDPLPTYLVVSDYVETDDAEVLAAAEKNLLDNRFFRKCSRLCVFLGPESKREAAARLVGGLDHVIAMDGADIGVLLSPVLADTSIVMSDATHISGTAQTHSQQAEAAKEKAKNGRASADHFVEIPHGGGAGDRALEEELRRLLGGTA